MGYMYSLIIPEDEIEEKRLQIWSPNKHLYLVVNENPAWRSKSSNMIY